MSLEQRAVIDEGRILHRVRGAFGAYQRYFLEGGADRKTYELGKRRGALIHLMSMIAGDSGYAWVERELREEWEAENPGRRARVVGR